MRIRTVSKSILGAFLFILLASSCDDDLSGIGGSIQPESDKIYVGLDTIKTIEVETIKLDSIHARSIKGVLGKYTDPIFGHIESNYMCELFPTKTAIFIDTIGDGVISIDSVYLRVSIESAIGDTISPAGLSVYRLSKELRKDSIYTNMNPLTYCDMKDVLGRGAFSVAQTPYYDGYREITIPLKKSLGNEFYTLWKKDPKIFDDPDILKQYFPGMYVTHSFGADVLLTVNYTSLEMYYSFKGPNSAETANDSTYVRLFRTGPSPEVIQVNSIENTDIDELLTTPESPISYLKTPAGVYSKFKIPLSEVAQIVGKDTIINSAQMSLLGLTNQEQFSKFGRPDKLLFINKDSVDAFFLRKNRIPDNITSFILSRTPANNSYNFNTITSYSNISVTGSFSNLFNYYLNEFRKEGKAITDLEYILVPVDVATSDVYDSYGNKTSTLNSVSHSMKPVSAILQTKDIKIPLVFTKYNDRRQNLSK